ncbi:MAG: MFS transporter [Ignavibacteria bacterium]|nr:MAG: MFS transporter [Ignavibacteria bacterium]
MDDQRTQKKSSPLRELIEPFIHIAKAPRALWGVNLTYLIEGMCYFGILTLLAIYFNKSVELTDAQAGWIVGAFTGGITLAMFFFGELADRWGVRVALGLALALMFFGRILLSGGVLLGGGGMWSPVYMASIGGLFLVVLGYGMYQPAAYTAVKQFTTKKTAAMGYAALYALMNLGGFLPGIISPPIRQAFGISGIYWVYTALTAVSVVLILGILSKKTVERAIRSARLEQTGSEEAAEVKVRKPFNLTTWIKEHPLRDVKFSFFIFILIPVQTLFAHQWLTLPQYVDRAFPGFVSDNMEFFVNLNPLLIFVLTPLAAALTSKVDVYKMMIIGTLVMAVPTFFLAIGPNVVLLFAYILLMSAGEAMWQPRFLQLAAELAPEGKTGQYMGIAQFPWFLTKLLTSLYSGHMLANYVPEAGPRNSEMLWLLYGIIAMITPISLFLSRKWMAGKLKTSAVGG